MVFISIVIGLRFMVFVSYHITAVITIGHFNCIPFNLLENFLSFHERLVFKP